MTPEAQQLAIAQACGWHSIRKREVEPFDLIGTLGPLREITTVPDYLNDLNAMHEAEKVLFGNRWQTYHDKLAIINCNARYGSYPAIDSTAEERAEAFLKTLNLWIDDDA